MTWIDRLVFEVVNAHGKEGVAASDICKELEDCGYPKWDIQRAIRKHLEQSTFKLGSRFKMHIGT